MRPIDSDALLEDIEELKRSPWYNGENRNYERLIRSDAIGIVVDLCIRSAPTLDYAPVRHGEWVLDNTYPGKHKVKYVCSACTHWQMCHKSKEPSMHPRFMRYCPNCGAKMDGKDGEMDAHTCGDQEGAGMLQSKDKRQHCVWLRR